jgi:hypothetical protein
MEALFGAISLTLFIFVILTMVMIIRDVLPFLDSEDQILLHNYLTRQDYHAWRRRDRAIRNAWNQHTLSFPKSPKRVIFAILLITFAVSCMGYPLWLVFGTR